MSATPSVQTAVAQGAPRPAAAADATIDLNDARPRRWGWLLVLAGFGGFMGWAATAPAGTQAV